jgi:hypothetical protein
VTRDELIAALERAKGEDRRIDVAIWELFEADPKKYRRTPPDRPKYSDWESCHDGVWGDFYPSLNAKRYTGSIDDALTLVPKGWTVARINQNDDKTWACELREGFLTSYNRVVFGGDKHKDPSAAIALCIASLRARTNLDDPRAPESSK